VPAGGGGGGTPGGADTYVQFNDGGAFGGVANLAYNKTSGLFSVKLIASQTADIFQVLANDGTTKIASIGNTGTATFARLVLQHYDQFDGSNLLEFRNQAGSLISSVSYGGTYTINSLSMGSPAAGGQDGYLRINKGQFQGGNQFEVSSDGTTVVAAFNAVFMRSILPASPTVDPDVTALTAGTMTFWIDETNNLLKFKVKYSNGTTVKSGSVALA
jgi:hypothetical protein